MLINGHLTSEHLPPFSYVGGRCMKKVPCYKCEERTETCHSECERYLAWAEEREKFRNERYKERQVDWMIAGYKDEAVRRANKAKRK